MYSKKAFGINILSWNEGSTRLRPEMTSEELGGKELFVLKDQYNIELFSCCLRLLAFCSSTIHQTNAESSQIRTEDNLLIPRIQSLHLLLEVDHHDEEYSVV